MRRLSFSLTLLLAALLATPLAARASESSDNPVHWSGQMSAGQRLTVKDINGRIDVTGVSGDTAEVVAEKSGRDADRVRVRISQSSDGVLVCVVYPDDSGDDDDGCGHGRSEHIRARVDFTIKIPKGVHLRAADVNGSVDASDLGASADVESVNGDVTVSTSSWAQAKSVNGSVRARLGSADWPDELELASVNGSVELTAPENLNADIHLETLNGSVESDFPYTVHGGSRVNGRGTHIVATIGSGGRSLNMKTVNGSLELRRE